MISTFGTATLLALLAAVLFVRLWRTPQLPAQLRPGAWWLTAAVGFVTAGFVGLYWLRGALDSVQPRLSDLVSRLCILSVGTAVLMYLAHRDRRSQRWRRTVLAVSVVALTVLTALWLISPHGTVSADLLEAPDTNAAVRAFIAWFSLGMIGWLTVAAGHFWGTARGAHRSRHANTPAMPTTMVIVSQFALLAGSLVMIVSSTLSLGKAAGWIEVSTQASTVMHLVGILCGSLGVLAPVVSTVVLMRTRVRALSALLTGIEPDNGRLDPRRRTDVGYTLRVLRLRVHDALQTVVILDDTAAMQVATATDPATALGTVLADSTIWGHFADPPDGGWPATMYLDTSSSVADQTEQQMLIAAGYQRASRSAESHP